MRTPLVLLALVVGSALAVSSTSALPGPTVVATGGGDVSSPTYAECNGRVNVVFWLGAEFAYAHVVPEDRACVPTQHSFAGADPDAGGCAVDAAGAVACGKWYRAVEPDYEVRLTLSPEGRFDHVERTWARDTFTVIRQVAGDLARVG